MSCRLGIIAHDCERAKHLARTVCLRGSPTQSANAVCQRGLSKQLPAPWLTNLWRMRILKYMLNQSDSLDLVFQALADPTRRVMVERLTRGPASVSELARPLDMSLPAVVQHLQVLEASGLVKTAKVGRVRTCTIDSKTLTLAEKWINDRRTLWERRLDRLGNLLDEDQD